MLLINGEKLNVSRFPDGTIGMRVYPKSYYGHVITWKYDGDEECMVLWQLVHHMRQIDENCNIHLEMPYIPNARMDRVKSTSEIFTLKWFAAFLNAMHFDSVAVLDAHSSVSLALIDRVVSRDASPYVQEAIAHIGNHRDLIFCYPDEGSAKRNIDLYKNDYVFGIKQRDWQTGKIISLMLNEPEKVAGRDVLIIDDICSKGGTFTYTARALKEVGAREIFLYVSHCENTIFEGSVLTDGLISHVFTTDSIFRGEHEKITILQ